MILALKNWEKRHKFRLLVSREQEKYAAFVFSVFKKRLPLFLYSQLQKWKFSENSKFRSYDVFADIFRNGSGW